MTIAGAPLEGSARGRPRGDFPAPACTSGLSNTAIRVAQIVAPVYAGDTAVRILNQSPSATLEILRSGTAALRTAVPTKDGWRFHLGGIALSAGDEIRVCQTHSAPFPVSLCSDYTEVKAAPASLPDPRFVYVSVAAGDAAVAVGGVHPGAEVVLEINGIEHARRWAGPDNAVSLPMDTTLTAGTQLDVYQTLGGLTSATNSKVLQAGQRQPNAPRIMGPLQNDDVGVWVTNVTPRSPQRRLTSI